MKTRKKYFHLFTMLMGLLMLLCAGMTVSAENGKNRVLIKGVEYSFYSSGNKHEASATIDDVRGDNLPTELYIPRKIRYNKVTYKVTNFWWDGINKYEWWGDDENPAPVDNDTLWNLNVNIPDKSRSYHARLKKIKFAKGIKVGGSAYDYENLRQVIFEDPNDLYQAKFYNCPKLKRLHFPASLTNRYNYDIKNCPSLKVTIDKKNKRLKMVGNDIYSKKGDILENVVAGKKEYKVPKGVRSVSGTAFWGNTAIEKIHLGTASIQGMDGLPNLKRIKVDKKRHKETSFYWNSTSYCPSVKRIDLPESIRYIYEPFDNGKFLTAYKHIYVYSKNLKGGELGRVPVETTFHVRNKKVEKKLRKFGFKGKIVIEKNMK